MNYLAHGRGALGRPWLLAGTALPDWLRVLDRRLRIQRERALERAGDADPRVADLARGVVAHVDDDARFHGSEAFRDAVRELMGVLAPLRGLHPGVRTRFVAHVLVEVLLDAELQSADAALAGRYYAALAHLAAEEVERVAERLTPRPPRGLARLVEGFVAARFVEEYADDAGVARRLDQTFARVRQPAIGPSLLPLLPRAREVVAARAALLLP